MELGPILRRMTPPPILTPRFCSIHIRFFIPNSVQSPEASCRHLWVAVKGTANPSSVLRRAVVARSLLPVQDSSIYTNSNYIISINSCRMSLTIVTREIFNSAVGLTHLNCHERQISDLILVYNQLCTYLWFFSRFCYRCGWSRRGYVALELYIIEETAKRKIRRNRITELKK